jgi:hypothetical protein
MLLSRLHRPMRATLAVAMATAGLIVALGTGCGPGPDAKCICNSAEPALFQFSCSPNDLTSVVATGPCSMPEAGTPLGFTAPVPPTDVGVFSGGPGTCHVQLTFASGFTYSTDVAFTAQMQFCACPTAFVPTSGPFMVDNPAGTCIAGPDAGGADGSSVEGGASDASAGE